MVEIDSKETASWWFAELRPDKFKVNKPEGQKPKCK